MKTGFAVSRAPLVAEIEKALESVLRDVLNSYFEGKENA